MCYTKTSSVELKIKGGTPAPPPKKKERKKEGRKEGRKEGKKAKVNVGSQLDVRLRRVGLVCVGSAAHQAPPSEGFSRQECRSGLPIKLLVMVMD